METPHHVLRVREAEEEATAQARSLVMARTSARRLRDMAAKATALAGKIEEEAERGLETFHALERRARAARDELPG